jgi:ribosomal protein S12 methylthiotransferase
MKRPANAENNLERIRAWRKVCPELTIRSTFIAGFPGETEDEFEELLAFLEHARLDRVGCFAYSPVDGAAANALPDHVPDAEGGTARPLRSAGKISAAVAGEDRQTLTVLVDRIEGSDAIARSAADAPEIDGTVRIADGANLPVGSFARVRITGAAQHDLDARIAAA